MPFNDNDLVSIGCNSAEDKQDMALNYAPLSTVWLNSKIDTAVTVSYK